MRYSRQVSWALIGVVIMALILLAAITMVRTTTVVELIRADQKPNIARAQQTQENTDQIKALAETIKSCTDPSGDCYQRSQEQTGEAVASINDVIIAAAVCAKQPGNDTVGEVRACVKEALGAR